MSGGAQGWRRHAKGYFPRCLAREDIRSVQLLLAKGARPDFVISKGVAAIHLAVGKENEKNTRCLKLLLQHGADPNVRSSDGLTPLHVAALWGCYQNLKLLLTNGGNPSIKDHEGNTPEQLAWQQENRKCAQLLQQYQATSAESEDDILPQFQYVVYSDQIDMSSYVESDSTLSSRSSVIIDFEEAPLSSTRCSSFFNLLAINGRASSREMPYSKHSEKSSKRCCSQEWDNTSHWPSEGPSLLSSTRMSAAGLVHTIPTFKEDDLFTDSCVLTSTENFQSETFGRTPLSPRVPHPPRPSGQRSWKSVSFREVDEYFPVFSPESPQQPSTLNGNHCASSLPFDLSEYSSFLDSERMATVLHKQGIDVTSPDHVFVFSRESSESTEEDMEKTVISPLHLQENDDGKECDSVKENQKNLPAQIVHSGTSSSGTSSSNYSSCESDHYTSALDTPTTLPAEENVTGDTESDKKMQISKDCVPVFTSQNGNIDSVQNEPRTDSELQSIGHLPGLVDKLTLSENICEPNANVTPSDGSGSDKESVSVASDTRVVGTTIQSEDNFDLSVIRCPFVTGRTHSRLSRSVRTSRTPESLSLTSSLFEEDLPAPRRTLRHTPRSQRRDDGLYNSPCGLYAPSYSGSVTKTDPLLSDCPDRQCSTFRATSSASSSQDDTIILPKSTHSAGETQTLCDTVVVEKKLDSSTYVYDRNFEEIVQAIRDKNLNEGGNFLTDGTTSADKTSNGDVNNVCGLDQVNGLKATDVCITEDCSSRTSSVSSSSNSSYFSPRKSTESSDTPCTPGAGCTPRYSMSRMTGRQRPQHFANLSYTPGGRPHIQDLDEPVEYLYTDTEQGHELIETHIPPTSNSSLSSSILTSSGDETVLYDWRSMRTSVMKNIEKKNQIPQEVVHRVENDKDGDISLPETTGLTDRELRLKLLELGESPGPISSRTRPTYMRKLCSLLQKSSCESHQQQKQSDQSQPDLGYSPELCRALQTFELPDCQADEHALCQQFDQPDQNRKWREGIIKSSFNYLLLDPRVTKNLPFRSHVMTPQECFQTFIRAIFYVGKGKRSRPYSHLYEALEYYKGDKTSKKLCLKVQHILEVWNTEQGVISLHCFQNVIPVEAYTREACMVEAIGLKMLTNQKRGDFYGVVSNWQVTRKRQLGVHLLYRAMQIFLAEGERQLRPPDIRQ
ncbi:ankyrin repeat and LEM domain-containing protein 1 [Thalassophryne amazonica]|uniref:ankyrin repeat and LEM domain-containing protein 1 n=1 Tax=Thalassophryne amazonica TaxID=390379 RepID=UPI001472286F|nr:ankyrin repeat and LEM domain-containing protein 1 [Thalassophryne amazonica]